MPLTAILALSIVKKGSSFPPELWSLPFLETKMSIAKMFDVNSSRSSELKRVIFFINR